MLRKTLALGIAFILAISLLSVSLLTSFTNDADAHDPKCWLEILCELDPNTGNLVNCKLDVWCEHGPHNATAG